MSETISRSMVSYRQSSLGMAVLQIEPKAPRIQEVTF